MKVKPRQIRCRSAPAALWGAVEDWDCIPSLGYRSLAECPEVVSGVDRIAELAGLMTIHLMENQEAGDVRVRDGRRKLTKRGAVCYDGTSPGRGYNGSTVAKERCT